jgi:hypothetical protein
LSDGVASRSTDQEGDLNPNFHLGGYGLLPTRVSTGPLIDGNGAVEKIYARAAAISNSRGQTLLLAAIENQGMFAAYKQGASLACGRTSRSVWPMTSWDT